MIVTIEVNMSNRAFHVEGEMVELVKVLKHIVKGTELCLKTGVKGGRKASGPDRDKPITMRIPLKDSYGVVCGRFEVSEK
jgi:hypothetical protein